jgi:serpin B
MPKYEFSSDFSLKKALSAMGMPVAFTENADFSGMDGKRDLYISDVIHKAFVSVDEVGTEAAAATAVVMTTTSLQLNVVDVTIDRPFIFLIRDIQTGAILFLGHVTNPAM